MKDLPIIGIDNGNGFPDPEYFVYTGERIEGAYQNPWRCSLCATKTHMRRVTYPVGVVFITQREYNNGKRGYPLPDCCRKCGRTFSFPSLV